MSATNEVTRLLELYGLQNINSADVSRWVGLYDDDEGNIGRILTEIRELPEYAERFPGMQARIEAGYEPLTEGEYIALESQYRTIIRNTGLPSHFYDEPDELAELIVNNVAPPEFESRVIDGFMAARDAPDEIRDALSNFYGVGNTEGALAAYFLDPEKGEQAILREFESAQVAGAADMAGRFGISKERAESLAALGVDFNQALGGFGQIATDRPVTSTNLGRGKEFSMDELLEGAFEGNAAVQQQIRRQRQRRLDQFSDSSGGGISATGVVGLQNTSDS